MFEIEDKSKLIEETQVHPLTIKSLWGAPNAWKLITKTENGDVTTIVLAFGISEVGALVQTQNLNSEGQVYSVSVNFVPNVRVEPRTEKGDLSRYDLVQMHSASING